MQSLIKFGVVCKGIVTFKMAVIFFPVEDNYVILKDHFELSRYTYIWQNL